MFKVKQVSKNSNSHGGGTGYGRAHGDHEKGRELGVPKAHNAPGLKAGGPGKKGGTPIPANTTSLGRGPNFKTGDYKTGKVNAKAAGR